MSKFEQTLVLIEAFNALYPDLEYDPNVHVILSDFNVEDQWLQSAIDKLQVQPETEAYRACIAFLQFLLTIPEDVRCEDE